MFSERDLRELLDLSPSAHVLSLYLNTNPSEVSPDAYRLRLRNMLKEVNLPQDVEAVERYFSTQYDWSGRGVVVFSCSAADFFRAYPLELPVRNLIQVSNRPAVKPLMDILDSYGGYGVVLVDKQGARVFSFHLGELREQEGIVGESVKRTKRGGASSMPGRRGGIAGRTQHEEETIDRNMKDAMDFSVRFFEENRVRRILIGGTDENVKSFRNLLPKAWQSLVVGSFAMSMTASHAEVLARALHVGHESDQQREKRLVNDLITQSAKGHGAVVGLGATLEAVNTDRVQTLVVLEGFRSGGEQCTACGYLTTIDLGKCPTCGSAMTSAGVDVVDLSVNKVMRHGGSVDIIHASPEFEKAGRMGALLRY